MDDDGVFKALADPTRRLLLDRLFERDGRTLTELESELEMTRFGGPRRHAPVGPGEAAFPEPGADPADP
jgi:DNA-binding transcriptional ArsR family regulator